MIYSHSTLHLYIFYILNFLNYTSIVKKSHSKER